MMRTKQTIAIIGLGDRGRGLATAFAKGKDRVVLFDKKEGYASVIARQLKDVHPDFDVEAINCSAVACWEAEVIIPAVPYEAQRDVANYVKQYANQKVVISINKATSNGSSYESATEELQELLPNSKVVRALFTQSIGDSTGVDCYISGKDQDAIETVAELVSTAGFTSVYSDHHTKSRT